MAVYTRLIHTDYIGIFKQGTSLQLADDDIYFIDSTKYMANKHSLAVDIHEETAFKEKVLIAVTQGKGTMTVMNQTMTEDPRFNVVLQPGQCFVGVYGGKCSNGKKGGKYYMSWKIFIGSHFA